MKKFLPILSTALILLSSVNAKTKVSGQNLIFDDKETSVKGYIIKNNNYFKLRDLASLLANTDAGFSVNYIENKNIIEISREGNYTKTKDDLQELKDSNSDPKPSSQKILVDGEEISFNSYSVDGYNYFSLRELGRVIGFYVSFDNESNTVIVKSDKLEPLSLMNNQEEVKIIDLSAKIKNSKFFNIKENPKLSIDQFFDQMDNLVVLTKEQGQLSAGEEYNQEKALVTVKPLMKKYKGKINYSPVICLEQNEKKEFFSYKGEFNLKEYLKKFGFDDQAPFKVQMGYYVGEETVNNFRKLSEINYKWFRKFWV